MATAIKSKPTKAEAQPVTFAEIAHRKMADAVNQYRTLVAQAAAGEQLGEGELSRALDLLAYLRLPEFAWQRDVAAQRDREAAAAALDKLNSTREADDARLAEVTARIKALDAELAALKTEQHTLANVAPMTRVSFMQRINELAANHPHLFLDVSEAVRLRQDAKDRASNGGKVPPAVSEPISTWSIGG